MKKAYLLLVISILLVFIAAWGRIMRNVEQAKYTVLQHFGVIEIRDYDPMIVAEVVIPGKREVAIQNGFRMIADYIFGNNVSSKKESMTAPVTQQESEKIAMTAPVMQQGDARGSWIVHFIMPSTYKLQTLPKPCNDSIKLREVRSKRYAVIRFSGIANQKRLELEQKKLETFILQQGFAAISSAIYAFFNPPWTLPFLRRNEIMIEVQR